MNKTVRNFILLSEIGLVFSCSKKISSTASVQGDEIYSEKYVKNIMKKVFTWQAENPVDINLKNVND